MGDSKVAASVLARSVLVPALGIALCQGWLPVVSAVSSAYCEGRDIAFVCAPLFFGYAAGVLVAAASRLLRPAPSCGLSLGLSLLGFMALIVTHSMDQILWDERAWPIGAAAFVSCLFSGFGSTVLGIAWVEGRHGWFPPAGSGGRVAVWTISALVLSLLASAASALGHTVWVPLVNGAFVAVSAAMLMARGGDGDEGEEAPTRIPPTRSARTVAVPAVAACVVLGLVFSAMIGQFLGAHFGRALPFTWVFGVVGVSVVAAVQAVAHKVRGSWDPTPACWAVAAAMVVAFYPIDAGSDFSLKFAMAGATCALWMLAATLPCALDRYAGAFAVDEPAASPWCRLMALTGLVCGILVGGPLGLLVSHTAFQGAFVFASAIASMVAGFVALVWLLHPRSARSQTSEDAGGVNARPDVFDTSADEAGTPLERRCAALAVEGALTPRELDVLLVLAQGYDTARVQEELGISEGTALTHKRHIYQKLDVHTRAELLDRVRAE